MNIKDIPYTALWYESSSDRVLYIDQTCLPRELVIREMKTFHDGLRAIVDMEVRGAPLIGIAAAFAMYVGQKDPACVEMTGYLAERLTAARPTAVNLAWAVGQMLQLTDNRQQVSELATRIADPASRLLQKAIEMRQIEIDRCRQIGEHGLSFIQDIARKKSGLPVNILTHCNAGWLATVDYGTALAPVYLAFNRGIQVHVWVDETRPRNQGAKLTVYELTSHGVSNTLIVDNAGGQLMQEGRVDMVIVGADRITANGDVVNKIGTYLKALAASDNHIPFIVAAPSSTFDPDTPTGMDVLIEERGEAEVLFPDGCGTSIAMLGTKVHNPGFDVTPARLVTGYLTEDGFKM